MSDKRGSKKEITISGGTSLTAGQLVARTDTNKVVQVPSGQTAATFAASIGAPSVKTVDIAARSGAFPDTGLPIFEVL